MKIEGIRVGLGFSFAMILLACVPQRGFGQHYFGLELGMGEHTQSGTFYSWESGAAFDHASGQGFLGGLFYESPISGNLSWGAKSDFDFKNMSSSATATRQFNFATANGNDTVSGPVLESTTIKLTYLKIAPYLQYTFFGRLFVQAAPCLSILLYQSEPWQLTLSDPNQSFPDGSHSEGRSGMLTNSIVSLRLSALFSAGYEFKASSFEIGPIVSFEQPFTNLANYTNWNVSSAYVSFFLKYQI